MLTEEGRGRLAAERVLDLGRLGAALDRFSPTQRATLLRLVERLADEAEED